MQQYTPTPTLKDLNEEKTILNRIKNLETVIVEISQELCKEKDRTNILMEIVGINKFTDLQ